MKPAVFIDAPSWVCGAGPRIDVQRVLSVAASMLQARQPKARCVWFSVEGRDFVGRFDWPGIVSVWYRHAPGSMIARSKLGRPYELDLRTVRR